MVKGQSKSRRTDRKKALRKWKEGIEVSNMLHKEIIPSNHTAG